MDKLLFFLLLCYTILLIRLILNALFNNRPVTQNSSSQPVSIVIPFRNEQTHLDKLLHSLLNQSYTGQYEILLVNDGSTDRSLEIIRGFQKENNRDISVLDSPFDPGCRLTSKQQALDFGISRARHNWIALTDADMVLLPDWLSSLMTHANEKNDLVFGHTSIITDNSVFRKIQAFQLEFLFAAAYTFFQTGITGSCMGNNILISKTAYQRSGGQKAIGYSIVEDRALYNLFRHKKMSITCTNPFKPLALTFPCSNWKQFFHQFSRWAKGGFDRRSNLLPVAPLFSVQNILFVLACAAMLPWFLSIAAVSNFLLTWFFTAVSFKKIESSQNSFLFPMFYLFLLAETVLFLFPIFFRSGIEWKGRKIVL